MNVAGEFVIGADQQSVFDALRNPDSFIKFVDGIHDLVEIDSTHYRAIFDTKVAYLKFSFDVTVEVTAMEAPHLIEAKIEGSPFGMIGKLTAKTRTLLNAINSDQTSVTYSVDSTLTGKLGSIGQPVLRSKAKDLEKIFAARLRDHFAGQLVAKNASV